MKRACGFLFAFAALAAMLVAAPTRAAEVAQVEAEEEGISAYAVARLKVFEGSAWVRLPDSGEWEEFSTNTPVPELARVNVPEGSEAELQFHGGQFVLLTGGTEVDVRKLQTEGSAFGLRSGEIRFDLPAEDFSPVSVTLPGGGKASFPVPGRYWLDVRDGGDTRLVVRSGESSVVAENGQFPVNAGQQAMIGRDVRVSAYSGTGDEGYAQPEPLTDEEKQAGVPPAAARELREYGEWVYSQEHGWVWDPQVGPDWSPYYYGRWAWISPYGWTWVSHEPWGWYPYHFGWWVSDPFFGWVWSPFHSFVSVSFVFGHSNFHHFHGHAHFFPSRVRFVRDGRFVRWVPLRPGERFVRSGFTRSDTRLARWNRGLDRGTVFVRGDGRGDGKRGKAEWRDFSTSQRGRTAVVDRTRDVRVRMAPSGGERQGRGGSSVRQGREGPARGDSPAVRQRTENRGDRQDRVRGRDSGGGGREFRSRDRDFRGGGGRGRGSSLAPANPRRDAGIGIRPESAGPPRTDRPGRGFREGSTAGRMSAPPRTSRGFAGDRGFSRSRQGGAVRMDNAGGGSRGAVERFQGRGSASGGGGGQFRSGGGGNRGSFGRGSSRGSFGGGSGSRGSGGGRGFSGGGGRR